MTDKKKDEAEKIEEFLGNVIKQVWGAVNRFGKNVSEVLS